MFHRRSLRPLLSAGIALALGVVGGLSLDDSATVPVTDQLGQVDLRIVDGASMIGDASMHVAAMRPGDTTAGVLVVKNTGAHPLAYHLDATASNDDGLGLGAALVVRVTDDETTTEHGRSTRCPSDALPRSANRFTSMLLASGPSGRPLAPGATETLCIQARLPASAPSSLQGATTKISLEVVAAP